MFDRLAASTVLVTVWERTPVDSSAKSSRPVKLGEYPVLNYNLIRLCFLEVLLLYVSASSCLRPYK